MHMLGIVHSVHTRYLSFFSNFSFPSVLMFMFFLGLIFLFVFLFSTPSYPTLSPHFHAVTTSLFSHFLILTHQHISLWFVSYRFLTWRSASHTHCTHQQWFCLRPSFLFPQITLASGGFALQLSAILDAVSLDRWCRREFGRTTFNSFYTIKIFVYKTFFNFLFTKKTFFFF